MRWMALVIQRLPNCSVLAEQPEAEGGRIGSHRPRSGLGLEAAHHEAADLLLVVDGNPSGSRITGSIGCAVDTVGDDVVLGRYSGTFTPARRPNCRPLAGG